MPKQVIRFMADDGTEFPDETSAVAHEAGLKKAKERVTFLSEFEAAVDREGINFEELPVREDLDVARLVYKHQDFLRNFLVRKDPKAGASTPPVAKAPTVTQKSPTRISQVLSAVVRLGGKATRQQVLKEAGFPPSSEFKTLVEQGRLIHSGFSLYQTPDYQAKPATPSGLPPMETKILEFFKAHPEKTFGLPQLLMKFGTATGGMISDLKNLGEVAQVGPNQYRLSKIQKRVSHREALIFNMLNSAGRKGVWTGEMTKAFGLANGSLKEILARLVTRGDVQHPRRGIYFASWVAL